MQRAYLRYSSENAPEEVLELLRRWIEDANDLIQSAAQGMQQQAAAQQQAIQGTGAPAAPPTSDLLPLPTATPPQQ